MKIDNTNYETTVKSVKSFKSPKLKNQAEPLNKASFTRKGAYTPGDGDFPTVPRPGSDDHLKYKSFTAGGQMAIYHRGHQ